VFVPFRDGRPDCVPIDVLGGFVSADGEAYGRPVGVAIDRRGCSWPTTWATPSGA